MMELQALSSKRSTLRDKLKKRREAMGSILSQAAASILPSSTTPTSPSVPSVPEVKVENPLRNEINESKSVEHNRKRTLSVTDSKASPLATKKVKVENDDLKSLLSAPSAKEKADQIQRDEILELLGTPTAKEQENLEMFRNTSGNQLKQFCKHSTKYECTRATGNKRPCDKLHFAKIIQPHTDESLGDCSFLNTCFHMDTCKYIHYQVDQDDARKAERRKRSGDNLDNFLATINGQQKIGLNSSISINNSISSLTKNNDGAVQGASVSSGIKLVPPQWVQCDLRNLDLPVLGKFSVVMADPPWDIHMELPYGTMSDDEMRKLPVPTLQDEGL